MADEVERLTAFARTLREEGLAAGPDRVLEFCRAAANLPARDLYWAGRLTLVSRPEEIPIYDRVFRGVLEHDAPKRQVRVVGLYICTSSPGGRGVLPSEPPSTHSSPLRAKAAGEYISVLTQRELLEHQIALEQDEIRTMPEEEIEELALIYRAKGLDAAEALALARRIVHDPVRGLDSGDDLEDHLVEVGWPAVLKERGAPVVVGVLDQRDMILGHPFLEQFELG